MPLPPARELIPEAGTYLRYWNQRDKQWSFLQLVDQEGPIVYPRRMSSLAVAARSTSVVTFRDLNPSADKAHRYLLFLGVSPGFLYRVFQPFDTQRLMTDVRPQDVNIDVTGNLTYQESPYDAPRYSMWVEPDRFPAIDALNIQDVSGVPAWIAMTYKFKVLVQGELSSELIGQLQSGQIASKPVNFGNEV